MTPWLPLGGVGEEKDPNVYEGDRQGKGAPQFIRSAGRVSRKGLGHRKQDEALIQNTPWVLDLENKAERQSQKERHNTESRDVRLWLPSL